MWSEGQSIGVHSISFGDLQAGSKLGALRQIDHDIWREDSDQLGRDRFEFREHPRSATLIRLHDTRRNIWLDADLSSNVVRYTQDGQAPWDLYSVLEASKRSTGWLVNRVDHGAAGAISGTFRQIGQRAWEELDASGKAAFFFVERARDDWSVYLSDTTRGVDLQCDLWRKKIRYRDGGGADFDLYNIASASSRVNGWTVRSVAHGSPKGAAHGWFVEAEPGTWIEEAGDGKPIFYFREAARDDWSVYLEDGWRGVSLQIDLWRNKISYGEIGTSRSDLYNIVTASAADTAFSITGVDTGAVGEVQARYRQRGLHIWDELVPNRPVGNVLHETKVTERRLSLHDAPRRVDLEVDLKRRKLRYSDRNQEMRDLYDISGTISGDTGRSVTWVDHGTWPAAHNGRFIQTGDIAWTEFNAQGQAAYYFDETGRDDWSVYMIDRSRNVRIQLDLWRRKVRYAGGSEPMRDLYNVSGHNSKLNGRLVNHVTYPIGNKGEVGVFRQIGGGNWIEDAGSERVGAFRFRETGRDDWSVYLTDDSRGVRLQIDLWRNLILYGGTSDTSLRPLYPIKTSERIPHLGLKSAEKVNWVVVGEIGQANVSFIQTAPGEWTEFGVNGQATGTTYSEVARDQWQIDLSANDSSIKRIRFDLFNDRCFEATGGQERQLGHIQEARTQLTGWLANTIGTKAAGKVETVLRQTGIAAWMETDEALGKTRLYDEIDRNDQEIRLYDPTTKASATINVANRQIQYSGVPGLGMRPIARIEQKPAVWLTARRMSSRSQLTEEIKVTGRGRSSVPVYRSSLSLSHLVTHIDVTASEQAQVTIDGTSYQLDRQRPVRIRAALSGRMSVSQDAALLQCPAIYIHTNLMDPGESHVLMADVEVHNRLATLKDGELVKARDQLGLNATLKPKDINHLQTAVSNLARTAQHTYNKNRHGVHHDRGLLPANMRHPHFKLNFASGGAEYTPLTAAEVAQHTQGAERMSPQAAQGFFDDVGNFFKKAGHVVVHTVENVGEAIVDTAQHVGHDIVQTVDHVGEDLVHGDILKAGKDLIQGGEHLGHDLVKGALGVGGALVNGAKQLMVVTMEYAGKLMQFVIDHTGFIGKAIGWLMEKAGAALGSMVRWLMGPLGWDDILLVHDTFRDAVNTRLDWLGGYAQNIKAQSDSFFENLAQTVSDDVDKVIHTLGVDDVQTKRHTTRKHSSAIENLEWLISKLFQYGHDPNPLASVVSPSGGSGPLAQLEQVVIDEMGSDGSKVRDAFGDGLDQLVAAFSGDSKEPEHLLAAILDLAKGVAIMGLEVVAKIIDIVLDLMTAAVDGFKHVLNAPMDIPVLTDFWKGLTDGRPLTILSIACLLIATPTTLIHKAATGNRPFASGPALALEVQSDHFKAIGNTYGSMHIIMTILGPIVAGMAAFSEIQAGFGESFGVDRPTNASFSTPDATVRGIGLVLGIVAQVTANPITPGLPYSMPLNEAKDDLIEAPNYWSHVIWHCQTGFLVFSGLANVGLTTLEGGKAKMTKVNFGGNVLSGTMAAWGVAHIALMGVLDQADRRKRDLVHSVFFPTSNHGLNDDQIIETVNRLAQSQDPSNVPYARPTTTEAKAKFVSDLRNYWEWSRDASPGKPIPNKGFGNVMDGLPEVGQLGAMPVIVEGTEALSLIGTAAAEFVGHLGEGATYLARTAQNELL